jgi:type III pantothenate kinase
VQNDGKRVGVTSNRGGAPTHGEDDTVSILAVDVGNTVTRYGLFEDDRLLATWDIATHETLTVDEARLSLRGFLDVWGGEEDAAGLDGGTVAVEEEGEAATGSTATAGSTTATEAPAPDRYSLSDGVISCVVPNLLAVYADALATEFGRPPAHHRDRLSHLGDRQEQP